MTDLLDDQERFARTAPPERRPRRSFPVLLVIFLLGATMQKYVDDYRDPGPPPVRFAAAAVVMIVDGRPIPSNLTSPSLAKIIQLVRRQCRQTPGLCFTPE